MRNPYVVFCVKCKHRDTDNCPINNTDLDDEDYCSFGEEEEEEEEFRQEKDLQILTTQELIEKYK